jgi:hypothetical protein
MIARAVRKWPGDGPSEMLAVNTLPPEREFINAFCVKQDIPMSSRTTS